MPNHVTNFVKAPVHILLTLLNDKGLPDFNRVIPTALPYPDTPSSSSSLDIKRSFSLLRSLTDEQRKTKIAEMVKEKPPYWDIVNGKKVFTPWEDLYEQAYQNILVTGFPDWYDWNVSHWGTKWNAYSAMINLEESDPYIVFQTAWGIPHWVYLELSKSFPGEMISVAFADESIGDNFGIFGYVEGGYTRLEPYHFVNQKIKEMRTVFDFCVGLSELNHHFLSPASPRELGYFHDETILGEKKGAYFIEAWESKFHHGDGTCTWFDSLEKLHKTPLTSKNYQI